MEEVFLSLGTNLGDKSANILEALTLVETHIGEMSKQSSIYKSASWGFDGESFENMVCKLSTSLSAIDLIKKVLDIESEIGRTRKVNSGGYANRLIDIDVLSYGNWIIKSEVLTVPHPEMQKRNFVLKPLVEIAPEWSHPVFLKTAEELFELSNDKIEVEWVR